MYYLGCTVHDEGDPQFQEPKPESRVGNECGMQYVSQLRQGCMIKEVRGKAGGGCDDDDDGIQKRRARQGS